MPPTQPIVNPSDEKVLKTMRQRYSPYRFESREVEDEKIVACLEAARWAPSSFNDQPWNWILAKRQESEKFETMLSCLMEANQQWANKAGVLILSVVRNTFRTRPKPNRVAGHDLGQASAHMALQAVRLDLQIHQMGGINISKIRQVYGIPDDHEPMTAIALGYPDRTDPGSELDRGFVERESGGRKRLPLKDLVFTDRWGQSCSLFS